MGYRNISWKSIIDNYDIKQFLFFCQKSMKEFWVDKFTRLETIFSQVHNIILSKQNQNSGLIPASVAITTHGNYTDAWV